MSVLMSQLHCLNTLLGNNATSDHIRSKTTYGHRWNTLLSNNGFELTLVQE
jgi:hypothetical protein